VFSSVREGAMLIGWSLSAVMGGALAYVTSHRTACFFRDTAYDLLWYKRSGWNSTITGCGCVHT